MALIMFDYDGVLVDSIEQFTLDFIGACQENGVNAINDREDALGLFDENVYESLGSLGVSPQTTDAILKTYKSKVGANLEKTVLFEGIPEALAAIAGEHQVYIVTSNISSVPETVLRIHGITGIKEVIGAEKEKSKIRKIKTLVNLHPGQKAFYIGDTKGDILEGKEAGVMTVGTVWGWHGEARLKEADPDYLVYSPVELAELLTGCR